MVNVIMLRVANKPFMLGVNVMNVILLSVIMLSVVMPSVVMLSVVMLSVFMLNVVAPLTAAARREMPKSK